MTDYFIMCNQFRQSLNHGLMDIDRHVYMFDTAITKWNLATNVNTLYSLKHAQVHRIPCDSTYKKSHTYIIQ